MAGLPVNTTSLAILDSPTSDETLKRGLLPSSPDNVTLTEERELAYVACKDALSKLSGIVATTSLPEELSRSLNKLQEVFSQDQGSNREELALAQIIGIRELLKQVGADVSVGEEILKLVNEVYHRQSVVKAMSDLPCLMADGLIRSRIYHAPPSVLEAVRRHRGLDPNQAQLIVIGGGPAGIALSYYASSRGIDTVTLEKRFLAKSMSDARAQSVHVMRTGAKGSSLARSELVPESDVKRIGMPEVLARTALREMAREGRSAMERANDRPFNTDIPSEDMVDPRVPVARSDVYGYFLEVAAEAEKTERAIFLEQTCPEQVVWDSAERLFHVISSHGHKLSSPFLAVATGFVGTDGELGRTLPEFVKLSEHSPDKCILINDEGDLTRHSKQLHETIESLQHRDYSNGRRHQMVVTDPLLGHQEIQDYLSLQPFGTRTAVVGSGESAAKAAVELLRFPNLTVDLFVKSTLEPSQAHTPFFTNGKDPVVKSILDDEFGGQSLEVMKSSYGTPITPDTMLTLLNAVEAGRVRLFELGEYFSEKALDIEIDCSSDAETRITIDAADRNVLRNLQNQVKEMEEYGFQRCREILPADGRTLSTIDGPIVLASGYDRKLRLQSPLLVQLAEQGAIILDPERPSEMEVDDECGLFSKANPNLILLGAGNLRGFADTSFSGAGVGAYLAAHAVGHKLQMQETLLPSSALALSEPRIEPAREGAFRGNFALNRIYKRKVEGEKLTPAEELMLQRGLRLDSRITEVLRSQGL
ncbi:MAG: hypothetical protein J5J00_05475 [Deltaproteobacteria bacterium]|nr:hypothetical protein [Deltaproteobacteria bacterium]